MVEQALFGDGCAAVVASAENIDDCHGKWAVQSNSTQLVENSSNIVKLYVNHNGLNSEFSKAPKIIKSEVCMFVDRFLKKQNFLHQSEIDLWGVHPGSPTILRAAQSGLALSPEKLEASWETLKNYGNMGSATVWFVIDKLMQKGDQNAQNLLALAFGPGVTIEGVLFRKC